VLDRSSGLSPILLLAIVPAIFLAGCELGAERGGYIPFAQRDPAVKAFALLLNYYAWILATNGVAAYRDGPAGVKYAKAACADTSWKNAAVLDTLAASYARDGKFDLAVKWQKAAIEASGAGSSSVFSRRLDLYEEHELCSSGQSAFPWF